MSAITTDGLLESNQTRIQDYFAKIPGVNFASNVRGAPVIAIRGLVTGTDLVNPTVGIVIDDVPFGSSTGLGGGDTTPDIDPSDLDRIEVLRGPQGTLYGASSLGGLVKYVTRAPSSAGMSGNLQMGISSVHNGADPGYNLRGSINIPVSDTLAVLVSGFTHQDPGYIDNPTLALKGVNEARSTGGRLSLAWKPTDNLSVRLSALYQQAKTDGAGHIIVDPSLGDLQQNDTRHTPPCSPVSGSVLHRAGRGRTKRDTPMVCYFAFICTPRPGTREGFLRLADDILSGDSAISSTAGDRFGRQLMLHQQPTDRGAERLPAPARGWFDVAWMSWTGCTVAGSAPLGITSSLLALIRPSTSPGATS